MSHNPLPNKERMKVPRQPMPERPPEERAKNFSEVNLGYDPELAHNESLRCLACQKPTCISTCPVSVKVKEFIDLILAGDYLGAAAKIREDNVLPAITGRVCPQEEQCEKGCVVAKKGESVGIGHLERFVADYEQRVGKVGLPPRAPATGKKVAIVGSGPAGLSCAGDLIQRGHEHVVAVERPQSRRGPGHARHGIAQRRRETLQDRGLEQKCLNGWSLHEQNLLGQIIDNVMVSTREGMNEFRRIFAIAHRKSSQLQSSDPTLRAGL